MHGNPKHEGPAADVRSNPELLFTKALEMELAKGLEPLTF